VKNGVNKTYFHRRNKRKLQARTRRQHFSLNNWRKNNNFSTLRGKNTIPMYMHLSCPYRCHTFIKKYTYVPVFYRGNKIWVRVRAAYELNHECNKEELMGM